ncbi:hypothetical protein Tsubulata_047239 [Turnera subulata]|uniref:Aspartic proteinase Asp1 n=1 Tax=Turnera subulata TaxID=218843 RepID=A0A9Q0FMX3_9ROSI|nr:hypothetical protein Tsubulata_047239 [Turnera subulata]
MEKERRGRFALMMVLSLVVAMMITASCSQSLAHNKSTAKPTAAPFSVAFQMTGNVYPLGYYSVNLKIGNPPKSFDFDIDTGSGLTWVQCDAPCQACTLPRARLYKPKNKPLRCSDTLCRNTPGALPCHHPNEQCDYQLAYADQGSSLGVLLNDHFFFPTTSTGVSLTQLLAFGCGYDQHNPGPHLPPPTAGVLGLGRAEATIVSQLHANGVLPNVFGHCMSRTGGGLLFFGDHPLRSSPNTWIPLLPVSSNPHYSSGSAQVVFGGKLTGAKGLQFIFDSGSSYTYFNAQVYQSTLNLIRNNLNGKPLKNAPEDKTLEVCWKAAKPIKSISEVRNYFQSIAIQFATPTNVQQLLLMPEDYLIVSKNGNPCLGILNGSQHQELGNLNVIGDIFMQDKWVIYDNEKQRIGWFPANCK